LEEKSATFALSYHSIASKLAKNWQKTKGNTKKNRSRAEFELYLKNNC
jgi:hypothetical protein